MIKKFFKYLFVSILTFLIFMIIFIFFYKRYINNEMVEMSNEIDNTFIQIINNSDSIYNIKKNENFDCDSLQELCSIISDKKNKVNNYIRNKYLNKEQKISLMNYEFYKNKYFIKLFLCTNENDTILSKSINRLNILVDKHNSLIKSYKLKQYFPNTFFIKKENKIKKVHFYLTYGEENKLPSEKIKSIQKWIETGE